jgi:[ribosomal protein S18]-alanine N-acetyltransferase
MTKAPDTSVTIRPISRADAGAVFDLQRRLFPTDVNSLTVEEYANAEQPGQAIVLVAEENGLIAGFLVLRNRGSRPWTGIDFVGVAPHASRRGVGRRLLEAASFVSPRPVLRLFVHRSNTAARALYARAGFRHTNTRKRGYENGEDALVHMKWVGLLRYRSKPEHFRARELMRT